MEFTYFYDNSVLVTTIVMRQGQIIATVIITCLITAIAIFVGYCIGRNAQKIAQATRNLDYDEKLRLEILKCITAENIEETLISLTAQPHHAGSYQEETILTDYIKQDWEKYLDTVDVYPYDVLLSYPNISDPNYVAIQFPNGTMTRKTNFTEEPLVYGEMSPKALPAFLAYTPQGTATGRMYYVNYARIEDFELLLRMNVNLTGSICLARFGKLFRGRKVKNAEVYNCSGIVIYSDPMDYAGVKKHSWDPSQTKTGYPHTWWLPQSGFQRGTTKMFSGDPLTPDYPSINGTYRIDENESDLPKIPAQPISYQEAYHFLSIMGGSLALDTWQGGLNITYRIGGLFKHPYTNCTAILHTGNYRKRKTIHNVVGKIRGWQEPGKYVMVGNHRDAWTFGALDPSSGTAVVTVAARAMGNIVKRGKWRPRRSILFCNWGAEEYGLIGSAEWVEQMEKQLLLNAVAYINIDIAVQGNATFRAKSTPSLNQLLYNSTKSVPNPNPDEILQNRKTVYDTWLHKMPDKYDPSVPFIQTLRAGSDYKMLLHACGIASVDLRYTFSENLSSYPTYHSLHDTFDYCKTFVDPEFKYSKAIADITVDMAFKLSEMTTLPLNPLYYAHQLKRMWKILKDNKENILQNNGISLINLKHAIEVFAKSAEILQEDVEKLTPTSSFAEIQLINDRLYRIDRGFLDFKGIPGNLPLRHVVFAPSFHSSSFGVRGFPGVIDAIHDATAGIKSWKNVEKQLSILSNKILAAANLMGAL